MRQLLAQHLLPKLITDLPSSLLQVSGLLSAARFQRYSGPTLESLIMQRSFEGCFDYDALPGTYPVGFVHFRSFNTLSSRLLVE